MTRATQCHCDVMADYATGSVTHPPGTPATTTPIYESYLPTPPSGTLYVVVSGVEATAYVNVENYNGQTTTYTISTTNMELLRPLILTLSHFRRITLSSVSEDQPTTIDWVLEFHYCKCCRA